MVPQGCSTVFSTAIPQTSLHQQYIKALWSRIKTPSHLPCLLRPALHSFYGTSLWITDLNSVSLNSVFPPKTSLLHLLPDMWIMCVTRTCCLGRPCNSGFILGPLFGGLYMVSISHLWPLCAPTQLIDLSTLSSFQMSPTAVLLSSPGNLPALNPSRIL